MSNVPKTDPGSSVDPAPTEGRLALVPVRSGDRYEEDVASKVEEAKATVRERGGHVLLYLHDSEVMATIYQDVHYAGPADRLVIYILRRKED